MFYGVVQETYVTEFDIKEALAKFKKFIKDAILKFIHKVEGLLAKCKDSKVKSGIQSILDRAKKLLGETENISTKEDADKIKTEYEKCNKDLAEEVEKVEGEVLSKEETEAFINGMKSEESKRKSSYATFYFDL